jgi:LysM repeat protein
MRDWLQRVRHPARPWLLALVGCGVAVVLIAAISLVVLTGPHPPSSAPAATDVSPQAAASMPEPTQDGPQSAASQATPAPSAEPSPFAGIAAPPAEPPRRATTIQHTVASGDVLWEIAEQYSLRPETVLWANEIDNPDLLLVGQQLLIPPMDGVVYTVRPGDSLADIASHYGVDLQGVVSSNQLNDADQIVAGTDIFLPGGRPMAAAPATSGTDSIVQPADGGDLASALLSAGWLRTQQVAEMFKTPDSNAKLHQVPGGARLERLDGYSKLTGRIQVRDPGDGRSRQAMTGWVDARDVDLGRAPATRELPQAYPADTAMDISHVFAPYRSQLDGSAYAEANCGPTALGMALDAFGVSVPPRQLRASTLNAQHMFGNNVGTLITALAQVAQENGLSAMDLRDAAGNVRHWGLDDIRAHIQAGHPVIVQVRYRSLPGRGGAYYFGDHYILVTGIVGDGFLYNDPIDIDGLGWDRVISGATLRVAMNASDGRYAYAAVAVGR